MPDKAKGLLRHTWNMWQSRSSLMVRWAIRLVMLIIVPRHRSPAAAQAWLLLIFSSPWLGLLLYVLIGTPKLTKWRRQIQRDIDQTLSQTMYQAEHDPQLHALFRHMLPPTSQPIASLVQRLGGLAPFAGNSVTLLPDYSASIQSMIADIDAATKQVHLLFYIFETDATGSAVRDALLRAAQRGVTCRVLIDAIGSRKDARTLLRTLRAGGIAAHAMLPVELITRLDLRNHRKIIVIDHQIGYTGSQNMVDATVKAGMTNQELMVRVTGPVVLQLQAVFLSDWYAETSEHLSDLPRLDARHIPPATGATTAQVLPSGPAYDTNNNLLLFTSLLYCAQKRAVITTPYFVPDESLLTAIESAALRGVDTHLIVSEIADQFMVSRAQRSYYGDLMTAGVHVHTIHPPTLLHAKHISIDDQIVVIGSSNMDMRSFQLDLEVLLIIYDQDVARALHAIEHDHLRHSTTLNLETWRNRPLYEQFLEDTLRLMSALL